MYVKREACLVHLVILSRDSELMIDQLVEFFMVESTHPDLNLRLNRGVRIFLDLFREITSFIYTRSPVSVVGTSDVTTLR